MEIVVRIVVGRRPVAFVCCGSIKLWKFFGGYWIVTREQNAKEEDDSKGRERDKKVVSASSVYIIFKSIKNLSSINRL